MAGKGQVIKVLANGLEDEATTVADIKAAAKSELGLSETPSAIVERDASGKVVAVLVPVEKDGVTNAGLANACARINNNNGVATCSQFPIEATEDYESVLTANTLWLSDDGSKITTPDGLVVRHQAVGCDIYGSTAAEAKGGSGISARIETKAQTSGSYLMRLKAEDNGIAAISAFEVEYDVAFDPSTTSGIHVELAVGQGSNTSLQQPLLIAAPAITPNYFLQIGTSGAQDTGVAVSSGYINVKNVTDKTGRRIVTAGNVTFDEQGTVFNASQLTVAVGSLQFGTPAVLKHFLDNIRFKITDGQLV